MKKAMDKIRVAVLYGGRSAEHEVSLQTAANIIQFLDKSLFEVIPIGIDKQGNWFLGKEIFDKSLEHNSVTQLKNDSGTWFTPAWVSKSLSIPTQKSKPEHSDFMFDVIFPAVHGASCEDGTLQGLLELADIPYVGCGVLGSAIGMDKDISKRLAMSAGIKVPPYLVIRHEQWLDDQNWVHTIIQDKLNFPVFVKPVNTGSSIGITKVKTKAELPEALQFAFQYDTKVIIEKALDIQELEVAVLQSLESNADAIVSVVGEIVPNHEFYSYEAKYLDADGAALLIPAKITPAKHEEARFLARKLFYHLECEGMARIDLFLDKDSQDIYFNELNTLPGFTQISMYPKLMAASGIGYSELLTHLIQLALRRHEKRSKLNRDCLLTADAVQET